MNRHVNAISGRLSLRQPQRDSLTILDRVCEILPLRKEIDRNTALATIQAEFPSVTDFDREFPSLCFSLATGVGKTRLMGAFITYLHLAHGIKNFFVLAPSLTIYNKLITDFTPNTTKYVFKGISEFAMNAPEIITGDNYEKSASTIEGLYNCKINIFNISKINSEVRGGKSPKIKRLSEYIGESYFDYLAGLDDLVILMDESHRYRASAGLRAINELKPILGLELTATPKVETNKGAIDFNNIIYDYPLGKALVDGFVKEPAVATRRNFKALGLSAEQIEQIKLEDGIRLHEEIKVELDTYARNNNVKTVKPFVLVIARDTTHAAALVELMQSDRFFEGRYRDKVLQVDSSKTGAKEDETIERLLKVESPDEPTEIVVHVNMLKEGWDVTNLYTIIPLRAANAKILIEQTIGRGLRLPYGKRTGESAVDRLNIVAHDKFQEIVDEAKKTDSQIQVQVRYISEVPQPKPNTVTIIPNLNAKLGLPTQPSTGQTTGTQPTINPVTTLSPSIEPIFKTPAEQTVAHLTYKALRDLENKPNEVPTSATLATPAIQTRVKAAVAQAYKVQQKIPDKQLELEGITPKLEPAQIDKIVAKTTDLFIQQTIDIPKIVVLPTGEIRSGFHPFTLDLSNLNYQTPDSALWIQTLRDQEVEILQTTNQGIQENRLEDYIVAKLVDFDDISYSEQSNLLYDLAGQVLQHFRSYLNDDNDIRQILIVHQSAIANLIHTQMQPHFWEEATSYEATVSRGFTELKQPSYTVAPDAVLDYRQSPSDKSNMSKYLFGGFSRCLYSHQKFQSDAERILSIILDRESLKWFKPVKGQFQIYYQWQNTQPEYQPDFVAETDDTIYMLEPKARKDMDSGDVKAKAIAAMQWCKNASDYTQKNGGKPWKYILIPHDDIKENMTLQGLATKFVKQTSEN
ncbi:DEAD/DEAH box helicase family protein [Alkalinema sp. FACHB-956]|uniref:DEAD/DEAH box helicase family protein n=1 Tax=Alkalinema sp. FACHB-956 TaxID=2692768 RepID=UPI001683CC60|nr:DEAD/DEAH box helicase family protein [Alkalinema sp. FACHB-956]MBD2327303.1 DEAD/DEAH box helicase family protein [Alkalinema sp. FACHB-956]